MDIQFRVNGKKVDNPVEWRGIQILASFESENVQASISTEDFELVGDARKEVLDHIQAGYYFEGIPFSMQIQKGPLSYEAFNGYLNLQDSFQYLSTDRVVSKAEKLSGIDRFSKKLSGLTYGYLYTNGFIQDTEVEYVVEKRKNTIEVVMCAVMIYLMVKELIRIVERISDTIAEGVGETSGGVSGAVGAAIMLGLKVLVDIAYAAALVIALTEMVQEMIFGFVSLVKKYKCTSYYELMRSACQALGYNFNSTIEELKYYHYLPSKPFNGKIKEGIPRSSDPGYNCADFFEIMKRMFSAQISIEGKTLHFENTDNPYFLKNSTWKLPSVYKERWRKNGNELAGTRLINFSTDAVDEWTVQNVQGTFYEVRTLQKKYRNGFDYLTIDSVDDREFPFALGNTKDSLNDLEKALKSLASVFDDVISTLGGSSNLTSRVQNRIGMLKMGTDSHTIPRLIYLKNGKIPKNHRDLLSAKLLYQKYIKADSFVFSINGGQKRIYENVRIPFGFSDFLQLIENSYFTTDDGYKGKVTKISWSIDSDYAELDYWIKDPDATDNLQEIYIEPS